MATTFDTEGEAQAIAAKLNAAVGREERVRYQVERYREKWAIARQSKRTYWAWDEFITRGSQDTMPSGEVSPKEVEEFRDHCVYIRSVTHMERQ
jgi:hypothetical protein